MSHPQVTMTAAFKPRAEAHVLSEVVRMAWDVKQRELIALGDSLNVIGETCKLFARLYPQDDMAVLRRYGKAELLQAVLVRIYSAEDRSFGAFGLTARIEIPEADRIFVPSNATDLYACGPRYSEDPNYGIKPDYRATMTAEKWAEVVAHHDAKDARRLPKE